MFLIILAIVIHLYFYFSALVGHTFEHFFPWGNVHMYQGLDFYQITNGAYAYLHGGSLTGQLPLNVPAYAPFGNVNVYHPFFTIVIGVPLQFLSHQIAFNFWVLFHGVILLPLAALLAIKYRGNTYLPLALFFFLAYAAHYLEIWNGQYHFLFNAAFLFLLFASLRKNEKVSDGIMFALTLLVKPIGLIWLPALIFHKRWKTIAIGLGVFALVTIPFFINQQGTYYLTNLLERMQHPIGGHPDVFTLDALLRFWLPPSYIPTLTKLTAGLMLLFLQWKLRINLFQSLFIWTAYYLLFYDLVFEYHYTTLAPLLALGVLTQKTFQTKIALFLSWILVLPTPFFLFNYLRIEVNHLNEITDAGWVALVLSRVIPLILLMIYVLYKRK